MSDNEDVHLPIPSRTTGVYASGVGSLRSGRGGTAGAAARSSRKVVEGLRTASSRRLNYSSFTSNGSNKGLNGENTEGSATGSIAGPGRGGGGTQSKSCSACGIQFTWRMRRHHCRGCKKVSGSCAFRVCGSVGLTTGVKGRLAIPGWMFRRVG